MSGKNTEDRQLTVKCTVEQRRLLLLLRELSEDESTNKFIKALKVIAVLISIKQAH